jgi:hypothetical protein
MALGNTLEANLAGHIDRLDVGYGSKRESKDES